MPFDSPFAAIRAQQRWDQTTLASNEATDANSGPIAVGQFSWAAGVFPAGTAFAFEGVMSVTNGGTTGQVILYNVTDAEVVALTTSSATAPTLFTVPLVVGTGVGELKPTTKTYEVRLTVSGTLASDIVTLGSARLLKR